MATAIKVIAIGNSSGIILPKETLARLNVQKGDTLYLTEGPQGIRLVPFDEEFATQMIAATPLGRLGLPEDIARVAVFLASDDAAWVTGERLTVSGGYK